MKKDYKHIIEHYESCFEQFGDSAKGVDWPNMNDLVKRFSVMLEVVREESGSVSVLDFGCGTALLKTHIDSLTLPVEINYSGMDLSEKFIAHCRTKFPGINFVQADVLATPELMPTVDYTVMNGVFTEKRDFTFEEMFDYFRKLITVVFQKSRRGVAFNVMSSHVDWKREDLFHLPTDTLLEFATKELSRHVVIRNDYGLYEYTVYIYKESF